MEPDITYFMQQDTTIKVQGIWIKFTDAKYNCVWYACYKIGA